MQYNQQIYSLMGEGGQQKASQKVVCPDCHKDFIHPRNLHQHQRSAHQGKRYYCQDCSNSYTRQYNLTHHRLKAHPEKVPPPEVRFLKNKYQSVVFSSGSANSTSSSTVAAAHHIQNRLFQQRSLGAGVLGRRRKPAFVRRIHQRPQNFQTKTSPLVLGGVNQNDGSEQGGAVSRSPEDSSSNSTVPNDPGNSTSSATKATAHVLTTAGSPIEITHKVLSSLSLSKASAAVSDTKKYACYSCPFVTENTGGLRKHVEKHGIQVFGDNVCKFCDYAGSDFTGLFQHAPVHFEPLISKVAITEECNLPLHGRLACLYCDRKFDTSAHTVAHEKLHK